jgi:hypothetical protein
MLKELGIIIIWDYSSSKKIIKILETKFNICETLDINWMSKSINERFEIINRLYENDILMNDWRVIGKPTKTKTNKKIDNIKVILINDKNPYYDIKITRGTRTEKYLNVNFYNIKEVIRSKYGKHSVHITDECNEYNKTLKIFNFDKKYRSKYKLININELQCVIETKRLKRKYEEDLVFLNITETPHYKYINNETDEYIHYTINNKKHNPNNFNKLINSFDYTNYNSNQLSTSRAIISVSEHKNTNNNNKIDYIICDGIHRTSILYKNLKIKTILVHLKNNIIFPNYISRKLNHVEQFFYFLKELNKSNIEYIFLRGFLKLPASLDTDLDLITKEINIITKIADNILKKVDKNKYCTRGDKDLNIANGCFLVDIENKIEFPKTLKFIVNDKIYNDIIRTRLSIEHTIEPIKNYKYYIPNHEYENILLKLRSLDKPKKAKKHEKRINLLNKAMDHNNYNNLVNLFPL